MDNEEILRDLYKRYFENFQEFSGVTSSHWRSVGKQEVLLKNGSWCITGCGFGDHASRTLKNLIYISPQLVLSRYLLFRNQASSRLIRHGIVLARKGNRFFNFDDIRQVLCLNKIVMELKCNLESKSPLADKGIKVVCVIGDGYSYFSNLLRRIDPTIKVVTVNLGRTLFFDVFFSQPSNQKKYLLKRDDKEAQFNFMNFDTLFLEAEEYNLLQGMPIDLFLNIASMQEMDMNVIKRYFDLMRSSSSGHAYFYCCNRIEKKLPDGSIIRFVDYPWNDCDVLFNELCPWMQKYPASTPPFWRPLDGPVQHKFVKFK